MKVGIKKLNLALLALLLSFCFCHNRVMAKMLVNSPVVKVSDAWARATVPGQAVGAVYMTLLSEADTVLIEARADVADTVEIHSMRMKNGVMKMRMLDQLALKAGQPYKLSPGGFHLMLFDLKSPLKVGGLVHLTLIFKNKARIFSKVIVEVPIKEVE